MGIQQNDVAGLQQVTLTVHRIAAAALDQQQNLAELMVMVLHLGSALGFQMKQPEILQKIASFIVLSHTFSPIARFATIIAQNAFYLQ